MSVWIDNVWFPHLVDLVLLNAAADDGDVNWLLTLGLVCRSWRQHVNARIGYHQQLTVYRLLSVEFKRRYPSFRKVRFVGHERCGHNEGRLLMNSLRFSVLQPALYPGRDICDLKVMDGSSNAPVRAPALTALERAGGSVPAIVSQARVLTVRYARLLRFELNATMPHLHTVRMHHVDGHQGTPLPNAHTYVWFRNPTKAVDIEDFQEFEAMDGEESLEPVHLCSDTTRKLVFCIRRSDERPNNTTIPPTLRPKGVQHVVAIMDDPHALMGGWVSWSLRNGFNTIVVMADRAFHAKFPNYKAKGWCMVPVVSDGKKSMVMFVTASNYRRKVGDQTFKTEVAHYLSHSEQPTSSRVQHTQRA